MEIMANIMQSTIHLIVEVITIELISFTMVEHCLNLSGLTPFRQPSWSIAVDTDELVNRKKSHICQLLITPFEG
jgi:hypothetical protein